MITSPSGSSIKGSKSKLNMLSVHPSKQSSSIDCNGISNQFGASFIGSTLSVKLVDAVSSPSSAVISITILPKKS